MYVSITRFRIKHLLALPRFMMLSAPAFNQAQQAKGNLFCETKNVSMFAYWTLTAWDTKQDMLNYLKQPAHIKAIKISSKIASGLNSYGYETTDLPTWKEAIEIMHKQPNTDKMPRYAPNAKNKSLK